MSINGFELNDPLGILRAAGIPMHKAKEIIQKTEGHGMVMTEVPKVLTPESPLAAEAGQLVFDHIEMP